MTYWIPNFIELVKNYKNPSPNDEIIQSLRKLKLGNFVEFEIDDYKNSNLDYTLNLDYTKNFFFIKSKQIYNVVRMGNSNDELFFEINVVPNNGTPYFISPLHTIITDGTIRYCENGMIAGIIKKLKIINDNENQNYNKNVQSIYFKKEKLLYLMGIAISFLVSFYLSKLLFFFY